MLELSMGGDEYIVGGCHYCSAIDSYTNAIWKVSQNQWHLR